MGNNMVVEIDEDTLSFVRERFTEIEDDVNILLFLTKRGRCLSCNEVSEIMKILDNLSDKVTVNRHIDDIYVKKYDIKYFPTTFIQKPNIRYIGIPSGYEFGVIIEDIVYVSKRDLPLPPKIVERVKSILNPVHIRVFVTPTCPYCPRAALNAHIFAMLNKNIVGEVIEAMEFPELADRYGVYAVPKIVINDKVEFEGAYPINMFLDKIFEALR